MVRPGDPMLHHSAARTAGESLLIWGDFKGDRFLEFYDHADERRRQAFRIPWTF